MYGYLAHKKWFAYSEFRVDIEAARWLAEVVTNITKLKTIASLNGSAKSGIPGNYTIWTDAASFFKENVIMDWHGSGWLFGLHQTKFGNIFSSV